MTADGMGDEVGQSGRILVVDDDPSVRGMVVDYLEEHRMRAVSVSGQREMVSQLVGSEPRLVILDLRPRQEDGLDLLRAIRSR
ncbi:MAG: two component transcriptional regulator, winged helix family, partial [Rhodospirillales bacterium]|nr:two component transcriptional regulator, winged helix family [Rhodospirillales bacterium]